MRMMFRPALAAAFIGLSWLTPAVAAETYFVIKSAADPKVEFAVTDEVVAKAGEVEFKSTLPDQDEDMHVVRGPLVRDLLKIAGLSGKAVIAKAADGYEAEIPASDLTSYDVIAAVKVDGKPITEDENGPARIAYPVEDNPKLKGDEAIAARGVFQLLSLTAK